MSQEISEAVQIIRVAYDGIEVAMRVGTGGVNAMLNAASFIFGMLDHEKLKGETSMRKLLMKGGDLQVVKLDNSQLREAKKLLKKYGILYSKLPDINKKDNMSEILIHSEAVPRINLILEKLGKGSLTTIEEYMENGEKTGFNKLVDFFDKQRKKNSKEEIKKPESEERLMHCRSVAEKIERSAEAQRAENESDDKFLDEKSDNKTDSRETLVEPTPVIDLMNEEKIEKSVEVEKKIRDKSLVEKELEAPKRSR